MKVKNRFICCHCVYDAIDPNGLQLFRSGVDHSRLAIFSQYFSGSFIILFRSIKAWVVKTFNKNKKDKLEDLVC